MTEARIKVQNNLYILDPIIIPQNCHKIKEQGLTFGVAKL